MTTPSPERPKAAADKTLQSGLQLLKQGHLPEAIQTLTEAQAISSTPALREKAQMGLVMAYVQTKQIQLAQTLVAHLSQSSSRQTRHWARQAQARIQQARIQAVSASGTPPHDHPANLSQAATSSAPSQPQSAANGATASPCSMAAVGPPPATQPEGISLSDYPWRYADRGTRWKKLRDVKVLDITWWGLTSLFVLGFELIIQQLPFSNGFVGWSVLVSIALSLILVFLIRQQTAKLQTLVGSLNLLVLELWTILAATVLARFGLPRAIAEAFKAWNAMPIVPDVAFNPKSLAPLGWGLFALAIITIITFPIVFQVGLRWFAQCRTLTVKELSQYSPEAVQQLRQLYCRHHRVALPVFSVVPSPFPFAFSYGHLLRNSHIVVSEGLLAQLDDAEIATICALEAGHLLNRVGWVLPWLVLLLQLPYGLHWQLATWGDRWGAPRRMDTRWQHWLRRAVLYSFGSLSSLAYGLFKLFRWPLLFLSRQRLYYADRQAANLTGNPNALARALIKIAIGTQMAIRTVGQTPALLESLELLMPLGYHTAIPVSHASAGYPVEALVTWGIKTPYRGWLSLNNAHPAVGDRLRILMYYANYWKLEPEFELPTEANTEANSVWPPNRIWHARSASQLRQALWSGHHYWQPLLLQTLPYWGLLIGLGLGIAIRWLGSFSNLLGLRFLGWLSHDTILLWACLPLGVILGLVIRSNYFFPPLKRLTLNQNPEPGQQIQILPELPLLGEPIYWQGTLIGRAGLKNWLSQDLWIALPSGLLKLHYSSPLGPLAAWRGWQQHPSHCIQTTVKVRGWFRRSLTAWIDLESLQSPTKHKIIESHPELWALTLGGCMLLWSLITLLLGF